MALHHMYIVDMDHGLSMAVQVSNLVMLAEMEMDPQANQQFNQALKQHGQKMFKEGKDLIQRGLGGPTMEDMMEKKTQGTQSELMKYTHGLGQAMLKVVDILRDMKVSEPTPQRMTMHHMHIALNHALNMAARGASLIMLGQMEMAPDVDEFAIKHGKEMLSDARDLWEKTMQGEVMKTKAGDSPKMATTHDLAEAGQRVIDMLSKMPESHEAG
jgi:hypothetical protein